MDNVYLLPFIFFLSLGLTMLILRYALPILKKSAAQPIYEGGPSWHLSKSGTPTMGGISFILSILLTLTPLAFYYVFNKPDGKLGISLLISLIFSLSNAFIGLFDDLTKLLRRDNAGLTPKQKIVLQTVSSVAFLTARYYFFQDSAAIKFTFGEYEIGFLYYPLALIILLGSINCTNLTDGVDGLASSVAFVIGVFFAVVGLSRAEEVGYAGIALAGGILGFLFFNVNPATVFMGDTGSLFLGAFIISLAFSLGNPLIILFIGIVYVIEGVSVILQVVIYKLTKKRLFKMAPLHHHLEKCGISENKICILAVILTLCFSLLCPAILRI